MNHTGIFQLDKFTDLRKIKRQKLRLKQRHVEETENVLKQRTKKKEALSCALLERYTRVLCINVERRNTTADIYQFFSSLVRLLFVRAMAGETVDAAVDRQICHDKQRHRSNRSQSSRQNGPLQGGVELYISSLSSTAHYPYTPLVPARHHVRYIVG